MDLSRADLRKCGTLKGPSKKICLFGAELPEFMDLSGCERADLREAGFSHLREVVLPPKAKVSPEDFKGRIPAHLIRYAPEKAARAARVRAVRVARVNVRQ